MSPFEHIMCPVTTYRYVSHMKSTPIPPGNGLKRAQKTMVALRMDAPEIMECKQLAKAENRSAAQFAYLMYCRGLAAFKAETTGGARPRQRGRA